MNTRYSDKLSLTPTARFRLNVSLSTTTINNENGNKDYMIIT